MFAYNPQNKKTVVVVGGGAVAASCVVNLRQEGFTGRIIMVCKENVVPYDRVKVSKNFAFDIQEALLRTPEFYDEHNIEVKLGVEAVGNERMPIITFESHITLLLYLPYVPCYSSVYTGAYCRLEYVS